MERWPRVVRWLCAAGCRLFTACVHCFLAWIGLMLPLAPLRPPPPPPPSSSSSSPPPPYPPRLKPEPGSQHGSPRAHIGGIRGGDGGGAGDEDSDKYDDTDSSADGATGDNANGAADDGGDAAALAALAAHAAATCGTLWHAMGGCGLGPVLGGPDLRLRGAANVHVAGSAAFPAPTRINPMATCYATGWRLGELLALAHAAAADFNFEGGKKKKDSHSTSAAPGEG